jgi:hypothetical protein
MYWVSMAGSRNYTSRIGHFGDQKWTALTFCDCNRDNVSKYSSHYSQLRKEYNMSKTLKVMCETESLVYLAQLQARTASTRMRQIFNLPELIASTYHYRLRKAGEPESVCWQKRHERHHAGVVSKNTCSVFFLVLGMPTMRWREQGAGTGADMCQILSLGFWGFRIRYVGCFLWDCGDLRFEV